MSFTILICTVGGSHEPILTAISANKPNYVCFFVTSGSVIQIQGNGNVIKVKPGAPKPALPNIPTQAQLAEDCFKCVEIEADDLDAIFLTMQRAIADLRKQHPDAKFIFDYTGGTKSMSAALVSAALEMDDVDLQLVTGKRTNLYGIQSGNQRAMGANITGARLRREIRSQLAAWKHFSYREAANGLQRIHARIGTPGVEQLDTAQALSESFALWDDFDHKGARSRLNGYEKYLQGKTYLQELSLLNDPSKQGNEPARLFDLWMNAERRARQGRYDDATGRWYRLMEWTAQWQLKVKKNINTADLPAKMIPQGAELHPNRSGRIQIGLYHAWQVVKEQSGGSIRDFIISHENKLRDMLDVRNKSILAHGFDSVSHETWQQIRDWTTESFLPLLDELAREAGLQRRPEQLPTEASDFGDQSGNNAKVASLQK